MDPEPLTDIEVIVRDYVNEKNRPLSSENVADGLKLEKALKALYSKQKLYIARQDRINIPNAQELAEKKETNNKLKHDLDEKMKAITVLEGELKDMVSYPTLEQIRTKTAQLKGEVNSMEEKLDGLRGQVILVSPKLRKEIEEKHSKMVGQWRKRKKMFKNLWDGVTEGNPEFRWDFQGSKELQKFKREVGLKYGEDDDKNLQDLVGKFRRGA